MHRISRKKHKDRKLKGWNLQNKTRNNSKLNKTKPTCHHDTAGRRRRRREVKDRRCLTTWNWTCCVMKAEFCFRDEQLLPLDLLWNERICSMCFVCVGGSKAPTVHANYFICGSQTGSHRWDFTDAETNRIVTDGMNHIFWRILIFFFFVKFAGQCKTSESSQQTLAESFWVFSCCFHLIIWRFSNQTAKTKRHKMF